MDIQGIEARRRSLKERYTDRDRKMDVLRLVRRGEIDRMMPDLFSDDIPKSVVANLVDVAARDLAEVMAPLPNLACSAGNMRTDVDRARAAKKNKIGNNYWNVSQLERQMFGYADSYNSDGFAVFVIEPRMDVMTPVIRVESSMGCYYSTDRWGGVVEFVKETCAQASDLAALYPEHAARILSLSGDKKRREGSEWLTIARYSDKHCTVVYLPECGNCVLAYSGNPLPSKRVPVVIAQRFDLDMIPRGQFDDVLWVQLARSLMALYQLQAADKSINAPIAVPDDVTEFAIGPDAVLRTQNPQAIQRVRLDVPRDSWMLSEQLDREAKSGARYPDVRTGNIKGNIVTGRGIEQLAGTIDTQLKTAQVLFKQALETATSIAFEMDVALWPHLRKTINGTMSGKSFEITYVPARDIGDNTMCSVTYGFAAGMTPERAIVTLLQLRGDRLIQRDTFRRALPFDIDPDEEQRGLDIEEMETGLLQGFLAYMQALGPMTAQGGDASQILAQAASAIAERQKGRPLHEALAAAFKPPEPVETPPQEPTAPPGQQGPEPLPGIRDSGLPQGVAPGQAGMGPGGMPSIQSLVAQFRGGKADMQAAVMRKIPTG